MNILHLDASILGANSASRQLSAAIVARLRQADPAAKVTYRDLAATPLGHLTGGEFAVTMGAPAASAEVERAVAGNKAVLGEFLDADTVVIGAPMYNFTIPSQLKTWIDRIVVKGQTFQYGATGPEGLAGNKRVIIAVSRGGVYGAGTPIAALEHVESYLRGVFGFLGVTRLEFVVAEGLVVPEQREKSMQGALATAADLAA